MKERKGKKKKKDTRQLVETQKNRKSTNIDLRKDRETVEDTYKDGEKKNRPQTECAVAPAGWMGCFRRGWLHKMLLLIVKLASEIQAFSFCSSTTAPACITHIPTSSATLLGELHSVLLLLLEGYVHATGISAILLIEWASCRVVTCNLVLQSRRGRNSLSMQKSGDCASYHDFVIMAKESKDMLIQWFFVCPIVFFLP